MSRRSKMLVLDDGSLRGTVGGGCLEAEVFAQGKSVLEGEGAPVFHRFILTEKQAGTEGLNCGGTVEIMTERLAGRAVADVLAACLDVLDRREEAVLVTSLERPSEGTAGKILVRRGGSSTGSLGEGGLDVEAGRIASSLIGRDEIGVHTLGNDRRAFLETIVIPPTVILFGGGHVSREVGRVAKTAGFRVVVVDDRPSFASRDRHPEADETLVLPMERVFESLTVDPHTYLVAVTRGHQHDEVVIRQALKTKAGYIGMLGSGRKVALMKKKFIEEGVPIEALDRLHAPIGLDIGADDPGEIAVSIVSELIAVRRRGEHPASLRRGGRRGR